MSKDYQNYTAADFIADEYFQQWVHEPSGPGKNFWEQWLVNHPEKKQEVEEARFFITNIHFNTDLPDTQEIERSLKRSLYTIESIEASTNSKRRKPFTPAYLYWAAAAAIIGIVLIFGWQFQSQKELTIEHITGNSEIKTIMLPDSSVVTLNAGSSIKYPANLDRAGIRELWLEGEAFFEVKHRAEKNSAKRFIVHSGNLNVEVLGTTFNVKKRAAITNVTLNTGKIKIDLENDPGSVMYLQPGDFVQYSVADAHLVKKQVTADLYSVWKEEKIELDSMPLSEVAQFIHDAYGYETQLEKDLKDDRISGKLIVKNEAALIETLSFVLGINIIKKDSVLIFQSKPKN